VSAVRRRVVNTLPRLGRAETPSSRSRYALHLHELKTGCFAIHILDRAGRRVDGTVSEDGFAVHLWMLRNYPRATPIPSKGRCPVCGESTRLADRTLASRLIATCGDAFTLRRWVAQWPR